MAFEHDSPLVRDADESNDRRPGTPAAGPASSTSRCCCAPRPAPRWARTWPSA
ncbi:hypothetical protein ACFQX8_25895 [Klenkia terrae]|uniref:hypothetical protein n=1 Tax=Klenkia terrae TaxID=1052259 RepID=UPI00360E0020